MGYIAPMFALRRIAAYPGAPKAIVDLANAALQEPEKPKSFVVRTTIADDERECVYDVDAEEWLKTVSADDLAYLCNDTGANETADGLYWFYDNLDPVAPATNDWAVYAVTRLGAFLSECNRFAKRDRGFSVRFDEDQLHAWVEKNNPTAWATYQKEYR